MTKEQAERIIKRIEEIEKEGYGSVKIIIVKGAKMRIEKETAEVV
jgi:hypothetical protein